VSIATWPAIEKRLARLAGELKLPPPVRSPIELATDLGLTLDPWQQEIADSTARQILMLCCRQSGKSTVAALLGLKAALYQPGSLTLIVSPSERQSGRLFRSILRWYRMLGGVVPADVENRLSLELRNGSEVHALPGQESRIRGFSGVDLLIEDEAARVPDDLYQSTRPMLAVSGGQIVLLSTPFGCRGHFWQEWEYGEDWHRVKIVATDCPRIDPVWLSKERAQIGEWWYTQEYDCAFVDTKTQLFATDLVLAALSSEVAPLALPTFVG
jgi:hypothetical protein